MMGTGTYANKLLTPSQTELISLLGQLEASSSCWGEEENSSRTTIENQKARARQLWKGCTGMPGLGTNLLHPAMPVCPWAALLPEASCRAGVG